MSGLGHILEDAGLSTVSISLVREHTERIVPPRALWVPFEFGRPLGVPGDADFQRRVLVAALNLLETTSGPVLADYPEDVPDPAPSENGEGWVCPVNLQPPAADADDDALVSAFLAEVAELQPWYDIGLERRGGTTFGASGLHIAECGRFLGDFLNEDGGPAPDRWPNLRAGDVLKIVLMDVKAYYLEAALARPGAASSRDLEDWFWDKTSAGQVFLALQRKCAASDDPFIATLGRQFIVPRAQAHRIR
ncbi:MAG: hypothetical protein OXU81_15285 [Gammaproteobacteria bacterium]|nr:hypothetical protein [Gammaproteobacteria bacterium]